MKLRDYQERDADRLREAMRSSRRVLYVAPTGSGKTVLFAHVAHAAAAKGKRVLVLLHRIELVKQTVAKLEAFDVAAGLVTARCTERLDAGVIVAAVQTLDRRQTDPGRIDLVVVDEAHHAVASIWERVLGRFEGAHLLGVTATPERLDGKGLADVFDIMIEGPDVAWLAEHGHLAKAKAFGRSAAVEDLKAIRTRRGDYDRQALAELMLRLPVTEAAVADYRALGEGRPAFAFCVGRHHAEVVALAFAAAGVPAANLDGSASVGEREAVLEAFRTGEIQVLASCDLLTEGFDAPEAGVAILLRPTRSRALHRQIVGRVLRPKADGSQALLLDYSGNLFKHGLPDMAVRWSLAGREKTPGEPQEQSKLCPGCEALLPLGVSACPECGHEFFQPGKEIDGIEPGALAAIDHEAILRLREVPYAQVLARARTFSDLKIIAAARHYADGWVYRAAREVGIAIPQQERRVLLPLTVSTPSGISAPPPLAGFAGASRG
jgi:superfamily II DNA or RNA helicase